MSHLTKQDILKEIQRTAKENGGKPLGVSMFEKETSIKPYDWGKYWARFGDALQEAGFEPNTLQTSYDEGFIIEKTIGLIRKLKKFPTIREIAIERTIDADFPSTGVFNRLGTKEQFINKVVKHCKGKEKFEDIIELCEEAIKDVSKNKDSDNHDSNFMVGEVYLFKSGRYYKIGKTNDTVRRGKEIRIQLPERTDLIHAIKTDDPSGVEAYWHKRFEAKKMQGEWFDLNSADIKAFKRWRRII